MAKIFEIPFFNRTFMETQNNILPTINGNPEFKRGDKGHGLAGITADRKDRLTYTTSFPNGTYSLVLWIRHDTSVWCNLADFLQDGGVGRFYLTGVGAYAVTSGTIYRDNVATTTSVSGKPSCLFVSGITLNATKVSLLADKWPSGAPLNGNIPYFAIYSGTFTATERDKLYQDFLSASGPTSSPTIIRPQISVDSTGSVLCHNYQLGNAADLSGNGNDGIPSGFVDYGVDGARFNGVDSYIDCGNPAEINAIGTGDFTIEALVKPNTPLLIHRTIVAKRCWGTWGMDMQSGKCLRFHYNAGSYFGPTDLNDNQWHLLGIFRCGNLLYFYNNGVLFGSSYDVTTIDLNNVNNLYVGNRNPVGSAMNAPIKFLKILPYAFTESQIKVNWNKIASLNDLHVMDSNMLPDNKIYTAGQRFEI